MSSRVNTQAPNLAKLQSVLGLGDRLSRWLVLDLNSFFASCEQQEDPELRDRPLIVVQTMAETTCAIAASYPAKALGIKTGTLVHESSLLPSGRALDAHDVRSRPSRRARRGRKEKPNCFNSRSKLTPSFLPEMCSLGGACDPEHLRCSCHLSPCALGKDASSSEFVRSVYWVGSFSRRRKCSAC